MPTADLTPAQAAQLIKQRRRMRESLVGFCENVEIPGAPIEGPDDESLISEPSSPAPKGWLGLGATVADRVFQPVGASMSRLHVVMCEAIQRCMTTKYGRLIITAPPGSAKSTYACVLGATWFMGLNPGARVILGMYATEIAKKQGRKARQVARQESFMGAFGCELSAETSAAEMWSLTNGAEYMAGGILSGMTGNRANGMILDDPIKGRQAADSPTVKANTQDAYDDDLKTRLIPGAWLIIIETRWTSDDIVGSILPEKYAGESGRIMCRDGMVWEVLNIPAECEHPDDPLGRPVGDGAGGVPGSMLWPEWFDAAHWKQYRSNPRTWSALFQQRPRPDGGNIWERGWIKWFDAHERPKALNRYTSSDYAVDPLSPDLTEHGGFGVDKDGDVWIDDWFYGHVNTDEGIDGLLDVAVRTQATRGFGEMGVIRHAIEPQFEQKKRRRRVKGRPMELSITYLPHIGNKTAKLLSFSAMGKAGKVHVLRCDWGERLEDALCRFPGEPDDAADVCGVIGRAMEEVVWARDLVPDPELKEPAFGSWAYITQERPDPSRVRVRRM